MPVSQIPYLAKQANVIEVNIEPSTYTSTIIDLFLEDKATVAAKKLGELLL